MALILLFTICTNRWVRVINRHDLLSSSRPVFACVLICYFSAALAVNLIVAAAFAACSYRIA